MGLNKSYGNCKDCACTFGEEPWLVCRRFPEEVDVEPEGGCFEFIPKTPAREILETSIELLRIQPRTRKILIGMRIATVEDILLYPRRCVVRHGVPDKAAINDIAAVLADLGVSW